jgi:hypothetical protein
MIVEDPATPTVFTFLASKLGELPESCEDVIANRHRSGTVQIALSDGATTASFSAEWARLLTNWFTARSVHPDPEALVRIAPFLGRSWMRFVLARPLPWHAEEKAREGSFATILGVTITGRRLKGIALGDTCLFHVRDGRLLSSFPYHSSEEFASRPVLVATRMPAAGAMAGAVQSIEAELDPADLVVMATDGLAQWLMRNVESDVEPWSVFHEGSDALRELVDVERNARRMRNDDIGCAWFTA